MSQVMDKLHADHINTTKLLDLLSRQLDVLHEGGTPDFVMLIDLMHYMTNYSGLLHHPKEDLVFTRMVERDPGTRQVVDGLLEEHRTLARIGEQFLGNLRGAVSELLVDREALERQGREYVRILRGHLDREESDAFPKARALLTDDDWVEIENTLQSKDDPVFGPVVEDEYRSLYDYLTQEQIS